MIEIRTNCEHCNADLPPNSMDAMICAFECTFCASCVETVLQNVCPNCGGGFEKRPVLRKKYLSKYSVSNKHILKPVDPEKFKPLQAALKDVKPEDR